MTDNRIWGRQEGRCDSLPVTASWLGDHEHKSAVDSGLPNGVLVFSTEHFSAEKEVGLLKSLNYVKKCFVSQTYAEPILGTLKPSSFAQTSEPLSPPLAKGSPGLIQWTFPVVMYTPNAERAHSLPSAT
jgi:hypothetical protein